MKFKDSISHNRELIQIIYGIVLIVLIPLLISLNTISIIKRYSQNIDVTLQRQALTLGRSINVLVADRLYDHAGLNQALSSLTKSNPDILGADILFPENGNFTIKASNDSKIIGKNAGDYFFPNFLQTAWAQNLASGLVTDVDFPNEEDIADDGDKRFWVAALPLGDQNGNKSALLTLKLSSEIVDELTKENRNNSIKFLLITIIITVLFLLAAVRLWDYALLYRKIKELDQMKDEFISVASHELRTPITSIRGFSSMMVDGSFGKLNKKVIEGARIISESSERLAILVDDLLNVSRIEQGRIELYIEPSDVSKIINSCLNELRIQADAKGLALEFIPHRPDLPLIDLDPDRLHQILINLLGNSLKYTFKGKIEVLTAEKDNGKILEIKIKDSGIGMSAKSREGLFQKFYRIRNEKTQKISGTGLGLWITKQLVELMNGRISIDSIEDVGTQISLEWKINKTNIPAKK
jgi:signal transduction histidine kinase